MRRWPWAVLGLAMAAGVAAWATGFDPERAVEGLLARARPPIVVGLLGSQSGPRAASDRSIVDAATLAIDEINAGGGLAGRRVEARASDGRSDPSTTASEARRLLESEGAVVLFGSSSAAGRKAATAVVEERRGLLFSAGNFEGMERSPRVIHAGGAANQSVIPAVRWAVDALKARRFFVVGSLEVWSRSAAEIAKDAIKAAGAELAGEAYLPMGLTELNPTVEAIRAARPDVVLSSILGDSNPPFYAALRARGVTPEKLPVVSYSVAEDELRSIQAGDAAGHFAAWNYFQSLPRPQNREFVRKFKAKYGEDRVVGDPAVSAYDAVMLWAQAVRELGTADPEELLEHLGRQSLDAPDSTVTIDPESHVFWRPFHVGRARADGQFDVVWSILKPVRPLTYAGTRSREQWRAFLDGLHAGWGGRWSSTEAAPVPAPLPAPAPTPPEGPAAGPPR